MNFKLISALLCTILLIPVSSFAQTSGIIPLDEFNHKGEISINNINVSEREYYKVIFMNVHVKIKDLALEDGTIINTSNIRITNENGKTYGPEGLGQDCKAPTFSETSITGSEGGIGKFSLCYRVEKEFNNFKVYYTYYSYDLKPHTYQIGNIVLNQKNEPTSDVVSDIKNLNMTKPTDFFAQLFEWLKNLFKFS
jgi:hypothetical protein